MPLGSRRILVNAEAMHPLGISVDPFPLQRQGVSSEILPNDQTTTSQRVIGDTERVDLVHTKYDPPQSDSRISQTSSGKHRSKSTRSVWCEPRRISITAASNVPQVHAKEIADECSKLTVSATTRRKMSSVCRHWCMVECGSWWHDACAGVNIK